MIVLHSQEFLEKSYQLFLNGFRAQLDRGSRVARGFADLGFEEFYLTSSDCMVSILSGEQLPFSTADKDLFPLLSSDELIAEVHRHGVDIQSVDFIEQRNWSIEAMHTGSDRQSRVVNVSLECALLDTLEFALQSNELVKVANVE